MLVISAYWWKEGSISLKERTLAKHFNGPFAYVNVKPRARRNKEYYNKWDAKIVMHNKITNIAPWGWDWGCF